MSKVSKKRVLELLISSGLKSKHSIKILSRKKSYPYKIMAVCELCGSSAQFMPEYFKEQVWTPWWGSLIAHSIRGMSEEPEMADKLCYGWKPHQKELRREEKAREIVLAKVENISKKEEVIETLFAEGWLDIDRIYTPAERQLDVRLDCMAVQE